VDYYQKMTKFRKRQSILETSRILIDREVIRVGHELLAQVTRQRNSYYSLNNVQGDVSTERTPVN